MLITKAEMYNVGTVIIDDIGLALRQFQTVLVKDGLNIDGFLRQYGQGTINLMQLKVWSFYKFLRLFQSVFLYPSFEIFSKYF